MFAKRKISSAALDAADSEMLDGQSAGGQTPGPLQGQVAVVTGAGRGIGSAIAQELAAAGAAVAIVDICADGAGETHQSIVGTGGRAAIFECDVTSPIGVDEMMDTVRVALGPVDILVNNVGGTRSVAPVAESDPALWWSDVELNLRSAYLCSWAVLPAMIERRAGRIINVASNGATGSWPLLSAYAAAKAGLVSFTSSLAAEVAPFGVRVFALHPGHVHTKLVDEMARRMEQFGRGGGVSAQMSSPDAAARLSLALATGSGDHLAGHFFADATDNARRLGWRSLARLGLIRRDLAALRLVRQLPDSAGPARPARAGAIAKAAMAVRGFFASLMVGPASTTLDLAAILGG